MSDRLKDKVAVVTGAGSRGPGLGNGKAAAILFAREGGEAITARSSAQEIGDRGRGGGKRYGNDGRPPPGTLDVGIAPTILGVG